MRLRTADHCQAFNASITTDHPASVPGSTALKRQDTGECISLGDCFGVPGHPLSHQKYEVIDISNEERHRLDEEGDIRVVDVTDLTQSYLLMTWGAHICTTRLHENGL